MADFEPVHRGNYLEGLLIDGDAIWYTDVTLGGVRRIGSDQVLLPERTMIGGLLANHDGKLLVSGLGGIVWADPVTGNTGTVVDGLDGVNEMRGDGKGGLWFGTIDLPGILRGEAPGSSTLRHLSADGVMTVHAEGLAFANGLTPSADGSMLFFNESFVGPCAWPIRGDGALGNRLRFGAKYDCDGMALDAAGNIWISGFSSPELICLAPDGTELRRIALPGEACTNVRFRGEDMRDIYVTMVTHAGAKALTEGRMPDAMDSVLYKARSTVSGAPFEKTRFTLA